LIAKQCFTDVNCYISEAENGIEAIEKLKRETFDLILMDIQMPEMDGVEATEIIRKKMNIKTPIIALTANAFKQDIDLYLSIGMNNFITKPYTEETLFRKIDDVLNSKNDDFYIDNHEIEQLRENFYDLSQIEKLSKGNKEFVTKMLSLFIDLAESSIKNLKTAILQQDKQSIVKIIHKLKPSVLQLSIKNIDIYSEELNQCLDNNNFLFTESIVKNIIINLENVIVLIKKNELN
jgi:CheY-like chemotaxis protein